ncbi:hypothetical protein H2O60_09730 [Leuconostoc mesenteroides]|uniref:type II restriction enzyme n=1 Tax=Leuconostoc TaxID=1243 RepID=UPI0015F76166|nr:hypothetical protein [Leuconostoc mesenteroides]MBA5973405.1 hypothetical protein [Leuconostoc mesenteroides]
MTKLDVGWETLFKKHDILNKVNANGVFNITAEQIKIVREPRLMTKFDWSSSRPKLFKDNELAILPDSRGGYVIGKFNAYQKLKYDDVTPIRVSLPDWVQSFDDNYLVTSESVALNIAQMTGMVDMVMDGQLYPAIPAVSTITGRLGSGLLKYNIDVKNQLNPYSFIVNNSQVEIDAGFESINKLSVIEAKNRIPDDFLIRQLYYPYRSYHNLGTNKVVMPIYFTHADDIYAFHIFEFTDINNYSSMKKVKQVNFIVDQNLDISIDELKYISSNSKCFPEPEKGNGTYPQANNFTRILNLLQYLKDEPKDKVELSNQYQFDERQGDYYANALVYLNFAEKLNGKFKLTPLGKNIASYPNNNTRNKLVIEQILNHITFKEAFDNTLRNGGFSDKGYIASILKKYVTSINSDKTALRRASTVSAWINWILSVASAE